MKSGDKVFVITGVGECSYIAKEGIAQVVGECWVTIDDEEWGRTFTILGTPRNRELFEKHVQAMREWKSKEPNLYTLMNQLDK